MRPYALRPPVFGFGFVSDFSGLSRVTSAKSEADWNRRPGLVGLRLRMGIVSSSSASEDVDAVVGVERDERALLARARAPLTGAAVTLALALAVDRVHVRHAHVEDALDGLADLDLVGVGRDDERVDVFVVGRVRLLRHDGADDDVARVCAAHSLPPPSRATTASSDAFENTMRSFTSTSYALSSSGSKICTRVPRLRSDFHTASSVRNSTTSKRSSRSPFVRNPSAVSNSLARFVFGSSMPHSSTTTTLPSLARSDNAERNASRIIFFGV